MKWQTPTDLLAKVEEAGLTMGWEFVRGGDKSKYLREAWVLARGAALLGGSHVRLSQIDPPDGYLMIDNKVVAIEVTELIQKGRRRGDEACEPVRLISEVEINKSIEQNEQWLKALIAKKLKSDARQEPNTILLVYHNTSLFSFDAEKTRAELEAAALLRATNIVGSIILYEGQIYGRKTLDRLC